MKEAADNSTGSFFQSVNQPEDRGVHGGGIVRAVVAVLLVALCIAVAAWLP